MKIKHRELEIPSDKPFENCKLEREQNALVLTDILSTYADGFVLAINDEWGTGKTTFVKMWQQQLKNEGFQTLYFNAWENDFDSNPFIAITSEINSLIKDNASEISTTFLKTAAKITKSAIPAIAEHLSKKYLGISSISDLAKEIAEGSLELIEEEIKEYTLRKQSIDEFRKALKDYIHESSKDKPLVFIIDELDRCRPNYAVEVLENIKHLFSVKGIVFVLSIDKIQLGHAIRGVYGSEQIDANEYLKRFIDLEYSLPKSSTKNFIKYLLEYYNFNQFFLSVERSNFPDFREDASNLVKIAEFLLDKSNTTLRQQEKIFATTRLILCSFRNNQFIFPHLLFVLVYLKIMKIEFFQKIERNELTLQELSDSFTDLMNTVNTVPNGLNLIYIEGLLLQFYNNNQEFYKRVKLLDNDESGNQITPIKSKFETENNKTTLSQCFVHINQQWSYDSMELNFLIKKINLTEPISIQ